MTLDIPQASEWMALMRFSSPLIAVFAASCAALALSALAGDDESPSAPWVVVAGLAASFAISWRLWPEAEGARIAMVSLDRLSLVAWMLLALSGLAASALSIGGSRPPDGKLRGDFFALIGFCVFGMGVLASAGDLVSILIGLETMSLAAYSLAGYTKSRAASLEGALKYFLMGAFATAFFAMGVAFIVGSAGTTDLALLSERASEVATGEGRAFFLFGCAMAAVGFAFKVAAVPFHAWAPDAYEGAPTPVTQLMATGVKAAAFFAFARFSLSVAAHAGLVWQHLIFALSVATMVVGNLAAIRQDNLKRMLAYSSIAHAGYILVVFPSLLADPAGFLRAAVLYLVAYVVMTAGAFASVWAIECEEGSGNAPGDGCDIHIIAGMGRRRPWLAAAFTLFLLSLAGFPPTLGFFGKYYLFAAAVRAGDLGLVVIALVATVVSVYFYLRPVVVMYFRDGKQEKSASSLSPSAVAVLAIAAAAAVVFGIFPGNLAALVQGTVF